LRENLEKEYGRGKPLLLLTLSVHVGSEASEDLKRSLRAEPGGLKFKNGYNCKQGERK